MFSQACIIPSVHGGVRGGMRGQGGMHGKSRACMVKGVCVAKEGMYGEGLACVAGRYTWQGAYMAGGIHGGGGAWVVKEYVWQVVCMVGVGVCVARGVCMARDMHGRGHVWQGDMHAGEMATEAGGTHPVADPGFP